MEINRRFLYAGVFLAALGGVLLAADLLFVDVNIMTGVLRLWPLAFLAIGAGLVLRRTRFGLAAGLAAVAVPAILVGTALAAVPRLPGHCVSTTPAEQPAAVTSNGTFDGPAAVTINIDCGTLGVTTLQGSAWQLAATNTAGLDAPVVSTPNALTLDRAERDTAWPYFEGGRDSWNLTLPTSEIASFDLEGTASAMTVDASAATIARVTTAVDFSALSMTLPVGTLTTDVRAAWSEVKVCTPPGVGLRVTGRGTFDQIAVAGEHLRGGEWQSTDYTTATHRIDLSVRAQFSSVEINPEGGCS